MRMPEPGPFGETLFEASERAMVEAFFVKSPRGGWVESVVTLATQRFLKRLAGMVVLVISMMRGWKPHLLIGSLAHWSRQSSGVSRQKKPRKATTKDTKDTRRCAE